MTAFSVNIETTSRCERLCLHSSLVWDHISLQFINFFPKNSQALLKFMIFIVMMNILWCSTMRKNAFPNAPLNVHKDALNNNWDETSILFSLPSSLRSYLKYDKDYKGRGDHRYSMKRWSLATAQLLNSLSSSLYGLIFISLFIWSKKISKREKFFCVLFHFR